MWHPQTNSVPGSVGKIRHIAVKNDNPYREAIHTILLQKTSTLFTSKLTCSLYISFKSTISARSSSSYKIIHFHISIQPYLFVTMLLLLFLAFLEYYTRLRTGPIFHSSQLALCPNVLENGLPFSCSFCFCFKSLSTRIWQFDQT